MRISRPCYDKPHRCPGWIGGGDNFPKKDRCENGSIIFGPDGYSRFWQFKFGKCTKCDVRTIPWVLTKLSPWRWRRGLKYRWWNYQARREWKRSQDYD